MKSFVGIDLGTTFSAIATIDDTGRPQIIHNSDGDNITPSCVTETDEGLEVGEFARRTYGNAPSKAAGHFKRDMGTSKTYCIGNKQFTPTDLSAEVLKQLKQDTEKEIGEIGEAVVTIPANFSNEARDATMMAAKAAGLNVSYIINEPTAAALYYSFKHGEEFHGNYAVYDLGGGTFDVSIVSINGQDIKVLATDGVAKLGGHDFDEILCKIVKNKYLEQVGEDFDHEDFTKNDAEEEKKTLSRQKRVTARVGRERINVSREEFEEAISSLVSQAEMACEAVIEEAGLTTSDIKAVLLAGGSTRIPLVKESVKRVFKQEPVASVNVDEVVALGATLYAAYKGNQSNLNPAQKNAISRINISEITSKYFGTLILSQNSTTSQRIMANSILINKGDKIPCSVTESFYTIHENQQAVNCEITECNAPETDPKFVKIVWKGNLELPSGRPEGQEIKITYSYDDNQIMKCSFVDVSTGRKTEIDLSIDQSDKSSCDTDIDQFLVE